MLRCILRCVVTVLTHRVSLCVKHAQLLDQKLAAGGAFATQQKALHYLEALLASDAEDAEEYIAEKVLSPSSVPFPLVCFCVLAVVVRSSLVAVRTNLCCGGVTQPDNLEALEKGSSAALANKALTVRLSQCLSRSADVRDWRGWQILRMCGLRADAPKQETRSAQVRSRSPEDQFEAHAA